MTFHRASYEVDEKNLFLHSIDFEDPNKEVSYYFRVTKYPFYSPGYHEDHLSYFIPMFECKSFLNCVNKIRDIIQAKPYCYVDKKFDHHFYNFEYIEVKFWKYTPSKYYDTSEMYDDCIDYLLEFEHDQKQAALQFVKEKSLFWHDIEFVKIKSNQTKDDGNFYLKFMV